MNPSDRTSTVAPRIRHMARGLQRLLPGAATTAALIAVPQLAHATAPGEAQMYNVLAAFGLLVAAATATSIATAMSRRPLTDEIAQAEPAVRR